MTPRSGRSGSVVRRDGSPCRACLAVQVREPEVEAGRNHSRFLLRVQERVHSMNVLTHLMFQDGRAREAAKWYVSLVPGSSIERVIDNDAEGAIVYFTLAGQGFIAFDSPIRHGFDFTPSMSIF